MSTSSSLSGINFSGLSSGIDTESIVAQLVKVRQQPITTLQTQKSDIQTRQAAIAQINAIVTSIQTAAIALDSSSAFTVTKATSSNEKAVTAEATEGAAVGTHSLQVLSLAREQRIASRTFSSQTDPLGIAADGEIVINGHAIAVTTSDSLQSLVSKINAAKPDATASVVSASRGVYQLVLSSAKAGTANTMQLTDVGTGSVFGTTLAMTSGTSVSDSSYLFRDSATSIGTLLGLTNAPEGTVTVAGHAIAMDLNTDTLSSIAAKLNAAGTGVTATIETVADPGGGPPQSRLRMVVAEGVAITDGGNILANIGVVRSSASTELVAARDARFVLDGLTITRDSNTVSDALTGVTLRLQDESGGPTAQITVASDTETIKTRISTLVTQYNQLVTTMADKGSFDTETNTAGPLFGDETVRAVIDGLTEALTNAAPGLTGPMSALSGLGITLDKTGLLTVDDSALSQALSSDLQNVAKLFKAVGSATDSRVTFVSATDKTRATTGVGYAIDITTAPSQGTVTGGMPNSGAPSETLTFSGGEFGTAGRVISIGANSTVDDVISRINGDSVASRIVVASKVDGKLRLSAVRFGAAGTFSIVSSQEAAVSASGIGTTLLTGTGTDVAGTINGEAATGKGQYLTGNAGNATTDGLQILVQGTGTGLLGSIALSKGVANLARYVAQNATDYTSGALSTYNSSLTDETSDIDSSIADLRTRLADYEQQLRTQFAAMESALTKLNSASAGLAQLASLSSTSQK